MDPRFLSTHVRSLIEPTVERLGFDLVAVEWLGEVLRVSIDAPAGISAEACARVSFQISPILDEADPIDSAYTLEVSSPGIERPIQRLVDFERFRGFKARVRLSPGHTRRRYTGVLLGVDGADVRIEVDGEEMRFAADAVERAHLILTLDEYQQLADGQPAAEPLGEEVPHDSE